MRHLKNTFTLIELLIVISIIVILAGLLLPSLNKAREMSRRIICANTLGQIGKAFCMYVQDYNDYLPPERDYASTNEKRWYRENPATSLVASEYLGCNSTITSLGAVKKDYHTQEIYKSKFICPSYNQIPEPSFTCFGYGYNSSVCTYSSRKITRFRKPSATCLLSESRTTSLIFYYTTSNSWPMDFRHASGVNVVFCDFHVEWKRINTIPDRTYDSSADASEFWDPKDN